MTIPIAYAVLSQDTITLTKTIEEALKLHYQHNEGESFVAVFDDCDFVYYGIQRTVSAKSFEPSYDYDVRLQRVDSLTRKRANWSAYYIQVEFDSDYEYNSAIETALSHRDTYVVNNCNGRLLAILEV